MRVSYNARWHDIVLSIAFRVWKVGLLQNHTCARENDRVIFRSVWFPPSRTTHFRNLMYWTPQIAPLLSPCSLTRCDFVAITYFRTVWSTHRWLDTRWIIWSYFYQYYYVIVVPVVFLEKIRNDKGRERGGDRRLVIFRIASQGSERSDAIYHGLTTCSPPACTSCEGVVGEQNRRWESSITDWLLFRNNSLPLWFSRRNLHTCRVNDADVTSEYETEAKKYFGDGADRSVAS